MYLPDLVRFKLSNKLRTKVLLFSEIIVICPIRKNTYWYFLKEQGVNDLSDFVQSFILLPILISQLDPACVKSDCVCVCFFFSIKLQ